MDQFLQQNASQPSRTPEEQAASATAEPPTLKPVVLELPATSPE